MNLAYISICILTKGISQIHSGNPVGGDTYVILYNKIIIRLIASEARIYKKNDTLSIMLKMVEKLGECPLEGEALFFTHSNCVLTLPGTDTHTLVNRYYSEAALNTKEDILNLIKMLLYILTMQE